MYVDLSQTNTLACFLATTIHLFAIDRSSDLCEHRRRTGCVYHDADRPALAAAEDRSAFDQRRLKGPRPSSGRREVHGQTVGVEPQSDVGIAEVFDTN